MNKYYFYVLSSLIMVLYTLKSVNAQAIPSEESLFINEFYHANGGWVKFPLWDNSTQFIEPCGGYFYNIQCNVINGTNHIVSFNFINEFIPASVFNLKHVVYMEISAAINQHLSDKLIQWNSLMTLKLTNYQYMSGKDYASMFSTLPPNIELLSLIGLNGSLPHNLSSYDKLTHITAFSSYLSGSIPTLPKNLKHLDLERNNLTGLLPSIPDSIMSLKLRFNNIEFCGGIPISGPKIPIGLSSNECFLFPQTSISISCYCTSGNCLTGTGFPAHYAGYPAFYASKYCTDEPPSLDAQCISGVWFITGSNYIVESKQTLKLTTNAVSLSGGLITEAGSTLLFNSINNPIYVKGEVNISDATRIVFTLNDNLLGSIPYDGRTNNNHVRQYIAPIIKSENDIRKLGLSNIIPLIDMDASSCYQVTAGNVEIYQSSLVSIFMINSEKCSNSNNGSTNSNNSTPTVWIAIILSVIGLLIAIVCLILITFTQFKFCRKRILPYSLASEKRSQPAANAV